MQVLAKRDDLLMVGGDEGPGVILYRAGSPPRIVHRDTAFAAGYWGPTTDPTPHLGSDVISSLTAFNDRQRRQQEAFRATIGPTVETG